MTSFDPTTKHQKLAIAGMIAASGGLYGLLVSCIPLELPTRDLLAVVASATVGAGLAGLLIAPPFGRPNRAGMMWACLGAVLATAIGSGIGGMIFFAPDVLLGNGPEDGLELWLSVGPISAVFIGAMGAPVWIILMSATHWAARRLRGPASSLHDQG